MKRMTVSRLAQNSLRRRKKQYITLTLGILLAMTFSSGTAFFVSCISASVKEAKRSEYTQAARIAFGLDEQGLAELDSQKPDLEYGLAHIVGYGYTEEEEDGAALAWLDTLAEELYYPVVLEGRLPEQPGEIAAEKDALLRMGLNGVPLGAAVTLNVRTPDGSGWLPGSAQKTYTLVGLLGDKRCNIERYAWLSPWLPALLVSESEQTEPGGREAKTAYIRCSPEYEEKIWLNSAPGGCADGAGETGDTFDGIRLKSMFGAVLAAVLSLASGLGIINAFNTNLSERKKQIGLLRAVGATKRQIVLIYGRESLLLALVCAPVSLCVSYFGVKLIASFLDKFYFLPSWRTLFGCSGVSVLFVLTASLIPLAAAARITPMQAIRNTELSRRQKRMRIRSKTQFDAPKLLAGRNLRFYRLRTALTSLLLAATVFLSAWAFSFAVTLDGGSYIFDYRISLSAGRDGGFYVNYDQDAVGYTENDRFALLSDPAVAAVDGKAVVNAVVSTDEPGDYMRLMNYDYYEALCDRDVTQRLNPQNYRELDDCPTPEWARFKAALALPESTAVLPIVARDESLFASLSRFTVEGEINVSRLNSGEEILLFAPAGLSAYLHQPAENGGRYFLDVWDAGMGLNNAAGTAIVPMETAARSFHAGDEITLTVVNGDAPDSGAGLPDNRAVTKRTVRIGAILENADTDLRAGHGSVSAVTTAQGLNCFTDRYKYRAMDVYAAETITAETDARIQSIIDRVTSGAPSLVVSNYRYLQEQKTQRRQTAALVLAVMILMLSGAGSMINNALTARIREGRREIGTLRAVGASARELAGSYVRELLVMTGLGSAVGFAAFIFLWIGSGLVDWLQYHFTEKPVFETVSLWETALGVLTLFAVCAFNLRRQIGKQMKNSIVDNIREL